MLIWKLLSPNLEVSVPTLLPRLSSNKLSFTTFHVPVAEGRSNCGLTEDKTKTQQKITALVSSILHTP